MVVAMEVSVRERAGVSIAGIPGANGDARTVDLGSEPTRWRANRPDRETCHAAPFTLNFR
jgi:hypothetical protein